jgi:predicted PurR-regulated permease PerM
MPSSRPTAEAALWILAILALLFFLQAARSLLIPIVLAIFIATAVEPAVAWQVSRSIPRPLAAALAMLILLGVLALGVWVLQGQAREVMDAWPQFQQQMRGWMSGAAGGGGDGGQAAAQPMQAAGSVLGRLAEQGAGAAAAFAGGFMVVVFLTFFLLLAADDADDRVGALFGVDERRMAQIIDEIKVQLRRFLLVRLLTAVIVGLLTWGALVWMNVSNAALWGVLAGVFNSIPYFGPVIVSGGLFVVGVLQGGTPARGAQLGGVALLITSLEGWLITPPLLGKAERMNAVAVFIGLLVWTWLWGALGTLLAVPMMVVLQAVASHTPGMTQVSRLLARRRSASPD